jgi:hypothetical protein
MYLFIGLFSDVLAEKFTEFSRSSGKLAEVLQKNSRSA